MNVDQREYTTAAVERHELLAGGRPFLSVCPFCMFLAMNVSKTRPGGFRLACSGCGANGFCHRADYTWATIGCGLELARMAYAKRLQLRMRLRRRGMEFTTPECWVLGRYGSGDGKEREVLKHGALCFGCGDDGASLRRDSRGLPYVTCARRCISRTFFPGDEAANRLVGWSLRRAEKGGALWNGWFSAGKMQWQAWHGGVGVKGVDRALVGAGGAVSQTSGGVL